MKQANITTHACFHCFECFSTLFLLEVLFFLKTILICIIRELWLVFRFVSNNLGKHSFHVTLIQPIGGIKFYFPFCQT